MKQSWFLLFLWTALAAKAQTNPAITSWVLNTGAETGFANIPTNVIQVQYSATQVYVSTNSIADWIPEGYDWPNNPWAPEAQNFVFKITLNPAEKPGEKTATPYGHIGIWTNGVSIYNPKDAKSWQDENVWFQNALYFEHVHLQTFDDCLGHPNNMHEYHTHVNPTCLYDDTDSSAHAPIIGFAFDGFPIYGAYAFAQTDDNGPVRRMRSSYRKRNISERTTLPDGTVLPAASYGPSLNVYPLGAYIEDFEYVPGLGDLDQYNGRFCITPEYPNGIYAYFVTIDETQYPVYPYVLGPRFFGQVQPGNMGPNSGHNQINEPVMVFTTSAGEAAPAIQFRAFPNPADETLGLYLEPSEQGNFRAEILDTGGRLVAVQPYVQSGVFYTLPTASLPNGWYALRLKNGQAVSTTTILVQHP